ncbi:MAG: aldo/keto reductase [Candidatus Latescibacteria bacterium]|nr:aldo/keto reductase [Candidatus Latescibacterota bacterium]
MKYRKLGQTGIEVSDIALGAYPIARQQQRSDGTIEVWSGASDDESIALIHRAEELGVNLLDSAEGYGGGHSEILVGQALKNRRDKWVIATKVQPNRGLDKDRPDEDAVRKHIVSACEDSLKRMQTDFIDVYQLHSIPHEWAMPAVMESFAKLKTEGKIRWYGISTNNQEAVKKLQVFGPIHTLQIGYNMLERSADAFLHWAKEQDIGTLIRVPLAKGQLTGKYFGKNAEAIPENDLRYERFQRAEVQEGLKKLPELLFLQNEKRTMVQAALRFVLDHLGVSCAIAGAKNREQIEANVKASDLAPLTQGELDRALPIADQVGTARWIG